MYRLKPHILNDVKPKEGSAFWMSRADFGAGLLARKERLSFAG